MRHAPLSWFLATSADWGSRHPRASCSPISDPRFTTFLLHLPPTTVAPKHQGFAGAPGKLPAAFRPFEDLLLVDSCNASRRCPAPLPFTVRIAGLCNIIGARDRDHCPRCTPWAFDSSADIAA
jgi:hypothetical protein